MKLLIVLMLSVVFVSVAYGRYAPTRNYQDEYLSVKELIRSVREVSTTTAKSTNGDNQDVNPHPNPDYNPFADLILDGAS